MSGRVDALRKEQALQYNIRDLWAELGCGPLTSSGMGYADALGREETEPSVQVGGAKNIAYDHGSKKSYDTIGLVQCVKGYAFPEALDYLVGPEADLIPSKSNGKPYSKPKGHVTTVYDYRDEMGNLLYQVLRYDPKGFSQRTLGEDGQWVNKLNGVRRVLYRLPELLKAVHEGKQVFIVEGEKDANNLHKIGLTATTCAQGAGKWNENYSLSLRGARVVIMPDNDDTGHKHAEKVAQSLHGIAAEVKVVQLPNLPEKADVSDWLTVGHTEEDLETLVAAAPVWEPKPTGELLKRRYPMTDLGNAERFADDQRGEVRFVNQWGKWIFWNGSCWQPDESREAIRRATKTIRKMFVESWPEGGQFDKGLERHSLKSESRRSIQDLLILASAQEGIPINAAELDRDPMLFNLASGTLDLNRGEHRAARQEDYITKQSEVVYDPAAECPAWLEFLDTIMAGNADLIGFLQRLAGYCLTGSIKEQKLFLLYGEGSNGKSTFLNTLLHIWGGYGRKVPSTLLLSRKDGTASNELAELFGVRLAVASETGEGKKMAESLLKELTGGEKLTGRRLYEQFFSWEPSSKIVLCTNHKPEIGGNDYAIWRRVCLVPFTVTIPEDDQDRDLPNKLLAEAPGIVNWCLEGLRHYQEVGLVEPEEVTEAVTEYRNEMDRLKDFLEEQCTERSFAEVRSSALRRAYEDWCQANGETCLGAREFQNRLKDRGFSPKKGVGGSRWWKGVGLKAEDNGND